MVARALHPSLPASASAPAAVAPSSRPDFSSATSGSWWVAEPTPSWGSAEVLPSLPPASLSEARALRDSLSGLICRERGATADFVLSLADFDRRQGWKTLGHRSLFAFLTCELRLSNGAAYLRLAASELLPRFPAVEAALRDGRLCLSAVGELARVLDPENEARFLPRFFGCSAREAREVAAELAPRQDPPRREVVTRLPGSSSSGPGPAVPVLALSVGAKADLDPSTLAAPSATSPADPGRPSLNDAHSPSDRTAPRGWSGEPLRAHEVGNTHPARAASLSPEVEPLTGDLRRLHLTVSKRLLAKLARAKDGLAHALPAASTEQVLEAALDLLLEKQDRRRALVKRPRQVGQQAVVGQAVVSATGPAHLAYPGVAARHASPAVPADAPACGPHPVATPTASGERPAAGLSASPPPRTAARSILAAVRREVWLRDGQRCQHPLDSGGTCGATARLEIDHLVPLALGGRSTADNLRVTCRFHNQAAAREILGDALMADQRARARRGR